MLHNAFYSQIDTDTDMCLHAIIWEN